MLTTKAFIFDLDGTVIQSHTILYQMLKAYFSSEQFALLEPHYPRLKGMNESQLMLYIADIIGIQAADIQQIRGDLIILGTQLKQQHGVAYVKGFEDFYTHYTAHAIKDCIATNGRGVSLNATLNLINIKHFFGDKIYTPDHVAGRTKPDPALFLYAVDQLGIDPHEAIIFEDSHVGVEAAHLAGIACIGINTGNTLDKDKDKLLLCVDDYTQLSMAKIAQALKDKNS